MSDGTAGSGTAGSGTAGGGRADGATADDATMDEAVALIGGALDSAGIEYTRPEGPHFVLTLPGEKKLKTTCLLTIGRHGVRVEAFVCRHPDEDHEAVYKWLLRRNRHLFGVHYTIDKIGDVYLVGRISMDALGERELDRVLGQVLEAADGDFNTILEIGFHTSIRREWRWRTVRGESLRNLAAFEHLITAEDRAAAGRGEIGLGGGTEPGAAYAGRQPVSTVESAAHPETAAESENSSENDSGNTAIPKASGEAGGSVDDAGGSGSGSSRGLG